jgi:hypothetical protein
VRTHQRDGLHAIAVDHFLGAAPAQREPPPIARGRSQRTSSAAPQRGGEGNLFPPVGSIGGRLAEV